MQLQSIASVTIPGYRIYEYLLVLNPHEELRNKIMRVKQDFYGTYKASTAIGGKPHITLANFLQYELMEERLVNRLKIVAMGFYPIKVELKDFGSFPSHTIYINDLGNCHNLSDRKSTRLNSSHVALSRMH